MIVSHKDVISYIRMWLSGIKTGQNKQGLVIPMTGGIDSCVCGALCLELQPIVFIKMGFKPEKEKIFEDWVTKNFAGSNIKFVEPIHPTLELANGVDIRAAMLGAYVALISTECNLIGVSPVTKSEYSLIKEVGLYNFDCYPFVDLYRSEVIALGEFLNVPKSLLDSVSTTEQIHGVTFVELEWLDRNNEATQIINSNNPTASKFWGLYSQKQKEVIAKIASLSQQRAHIEFVEKKMCNVRKSLPGSVS